MSYKIVLILFVRTSISHGIHSELGQDPVDSRTLRTKFVSSSPHGGKVDKITIKFKSNLTHFKHDIVFFYVLCRI